MNAVNLFCDSGLFWPTLDTSSPKAIAWRDTVKDGKDEVGYVGKTFHLSCGPGLCPAVSNHLCSQNNTLLNQVVSENILKEFIK